MNSIQQDGAIALAKSLMNNRPFVGIFGWIFLDDRNPTGFPSGRCFLEESFLLMGG